MPLISKRRMKTRQNSEMYSCASKAVCKLEKARQSKGSGVSVCTPGEVEVPQSGSLVSG